MERETMENLEQLGALKENNRIMAILLKLKENKELAETTVSKLAKLFYKRD